MNYQPRGNQFSLAEIESLLARIARVKAQRETERDPALCVLQDAVLEELEAQCSRFGALDAARRD